MPTGRWWLVTFGVVVGFVACAGPAPRTDDASPPDLTAPPTAELTTSTSAAAVSAPTEPDTPDQGGPEPSDPTSSLAPGPPTTLPGSSGAASSAATTAPPSSATGPAAGSETGSDPTGGAIAGSEPIPIRIRLDRRVADAATEGFAPFVELVLTDQRGWEQAGFVFSFSDTDFDYTVVLAEGSEVDSLCLPYDTFGRFSCQIGPVVALNADRWRTAVESWPATLDEYRTMLVNHEVGHLLGQHHPAERCPGDGRPAPVMAQQSSGVAPCTANPWPLPWEITCAASGLEPLAPPFERGIQLTCGPDGPIG